MEIIENVLFFIQNANLLTFFTKIFGIALGGLYLFFVLVLVQQVVSLKRVVVILDRGLLLFIAQIQFVIAVVILLYAIVLL